MLDIGYISKLIIILFSKWIILLDGQLRHLDNIALFKPVGTYPDSPAATSVVDGDRGTLRTCAAVQVSDFGIAYFRVDLLRSHAVTNVIVACGKDVPGSCSNFRILVMAKWEFSQPADFWRNNYTECAHQDEPLPDEEVRRYPCEATSSGRHVVVVKTAVKNSVLQLCEIEVYDVNSYTNEALKKHSMMLTYNSNWYYAPIGNDGHTGHDAISSNDDRVSLDYWAVDLGQEYRIRRIMIVNTVVEQYASYFQKFKFLVTSNFHPKHLDRNDFIECYHQPTPLERSESIEKVCDFKTVGRYVLIYKYNCESRGILLAEAEVTATPVEENIALKKSTLMIGELGKRVKTSGKAVDGILSTTMGAGSCIQTPGRDRVEWWMVDLIHLYRIRNVALVSVGEQLTCAKLMGVNSNSKFVNDSQLTASSSDGSYLPVRGRLWTPVQAGQDAWCASSTSPDEYFQVDFVKAVHISGMMIGGSATGHATVIYVSYILMGSRYTFLKDDKGNKMKFPGSPGGQKHRTVWFPNAVRLRIIRIHPAEYVNKPCLTVEFMGCLGGTGNTLKNFKIQTAITFNPRSYSKNKFHVCYSMKEEFPAGYIRPIYCPTRPLARYVLLEKTSSTTKTAVRICEFEVYGKKHDGNLAYGKPTHQSSTYWRYQSRLAVDGDRRNHLTTHVSCSQTLTGSNITQNWWAVDLGQTYDVGWLVIVAHKDCGCDCVQKFRILLTDKFNPNNVTESDYTTCLTHRDALRSGQVKRLYCEASARGQFVVILAPGSPPLTLCEVEVLERNAMNANLALGKPCSQSSEGAAYAWTCDLANDGLKLPDFSDGSCTMTGDKMADAWWHVDLLLIYQIRKLVILNRLYPFSERLRNFKVSISKIFRPYELDKIPSSLCFSQPAPLKPGEERTIYCPNKPIGRHVTILKTPSIGEPLTLCEVEVYGTPVEDNLAWFQPTYQSTDQDQPTSRKAVDGQTSPNFYDGSCTMTLTDRERQWWSVDLGRTFVIDRVVITNRADCCSERLRNYRVIATSSLPGDDVMKSPYSLCSDRRTTMGGEFIKIVCLAHTIGRFVTVVKDKTTGEPLTLCEVEVYGTEYSIIFGQNLAKGKSSSQSGLKPGGSYLAVDGNPATDPLHCTKTPGVEGREWWAVDIGSEDNITTVKIATSTASDGAYIYLAAYILEDISKSTFDALGLSMPYTWNQPGDTWKEDQQTTLETPTTSLPVTSSPTFPKQGKGFRQCGLFAGRISGGQEIALPCDESIWGRYVLIVKNNCFRDPLVVCEVQVFGPKLYQTSTEPSWNTAEPPTQATQGNMSGFGNSREKRNAASPLVASPDHDVPGTTHRGYVYSIAALAVVSFITMKLLKRH